MIDNLSITVHLISLSVDEILLLRYLNLSTNFRCTLLKLKMSFSFQTHELCFFCIHVETNTSCCLLQFMQQGIGLGRCICKKFYVIFIISICYSFSRMSSAPYLFFSVKPCYLISSVND